MIELGKEALDALANGIKFNSGLKRLELSYCMIQDKHAAYIAKIISEQGELRESRIWQESLRQSKLSGKDKLDQMISEVSKVVGLTDFNFRHNFLGPIFMSKLASALKNDQYCRSIDLQGNKITEQMVDKEFLACLYANESVMNLDLRNNDGISKETLKKVALSLLKNVALLKERKQPCLK